MKKKIQRICIVSLVLLVFGFTFAHVTRSDSKVTPRADLPPGVEILKPTPAQPSADNRIGIPYPPPPKTVSGVLQPTSKNFLLAEQRSKEWEQWLIDEGWVNPDGSQKYVPGEVVVQFQNEVRDLVQPTTRQGTPIFGIATVDLINEKYKARSLERVIKSEDVKPTKRESHLRHGLDLIYLIKFSEDADVKQIADEYLNDPAVKEASPNWQSYPLNLPDSIPDDPYYDSTPWSWDEVSFPEAWAVETGDPDVWVAQIALGPSNTAGARPDTAHTDIYGNYAHFYGGDVSGGISDHSTACVATMSARTNNASYQPGGAGGWGTDAGCTWTFYGMLNSVTGQINAFTWCGDVATDSGCVAASVSWGGGGPGAGVEAAMKHSADEGCLICCAAGNRFWPSIHYPAYFGSAIAVGGCYGQENVFTYGHWLECITNAYHWSLAYDGGAGGTSFSAPKAAATIALVKSQHPTYTTSQLRDALVYSADWVDYLPWHQSWNLSGQLGGGAVNAYEAMKLYDTNVSVNRIWRPRVDEGDSLDTYVTVTPQVVVQNRGASMASFDVVLKIDTLGGATIYADTVLVGGLADRTDKMYKGRLISFKDWTVGGVNAKYEITAYTTLSGDQSTVNDTLTDTVYVTSSEAEWLQRDDGFNYTNGGNPLIAATCLMPVPATACSILGAKIWTYYESSGSSFDVYVIPDSSGHDYRYAPEHYTHAWISQNVPVGDVNKYGWVDVTFTSPIVWTPDSGMFHITCHQAASDLYFGLDNTVPYGDEIGRYSWLIMWSTWESGWWWSGLDPMVKQFRTKIKYLLYDNDVSVTQLIPPDEHELSTVPLIPQAVVKNTGKNAQSGFDVLLKIDSVTTTVYRDSQTVSTSLGKYDETTLSFAGWAPGWDNGTYTVRCSTRLSGDQNTANDAFDKNVLVNNIDTLQYDDGLSRWGYTNNNTQWATTFYPARPCSVLGMDFKLWVGGSPDNCTLYAYEAENDTPTTQIFTPHVHTPADGWNTYTFSPVEKFHRPNAEDFSLVIWTYGMQPPDTCMPLFDDSDEAPYHNYWYDKAWIGPSWNDQMMRARIKYTQGTYNHDVTVTAFTNPLAYDYVTPNKPVSPHVTVENVGNGDPEQFDVVFMIDYIDGGTEYADTQNVTVGLAASKEVGFDDWTPAYPDTDYTITAWSTDTDDQNRTNDTLGSEVYSRTINIIRYNIDPYGDPFVYDDPYHAVKFTPARPCTVWGAYLCVWANTDHNTFPCTLFLWKDTLDRPASASYLDLDTFSLEGIGATLGGYTYRFRRDFMHDDTLHGSTYETDGDFWLGLFTQLGTGADSLRGTGSEFLEYENITGRSMSNDDRTSDDQWYGPQWISQTASDTDTCSINWEIWALVKYFDNPYDDVLPPHIMVTKSGSDAVITWPGVWVDVSDRPTDCEYETYEDASYNFIPDGYLLNAGPETTYTHTNALTASNHNYLVFANNYAYNPYGTKSAKSNMGYVLDRTLVDNSPTATNRNWVSLPYNSGYTTVSTLVSDLSPSGDPVTKVTQLRDDQIYQSYRFVTFPFPHWEGINFTITSGKAYEMVTKDGAANLDVTLVGSNEPDSGIHLVGNATTTNRNWVSIPYNAAYDSVQDIATSDFPSGDPVTKITNLRDDQIYQSYRFVTFPFPHWEGIKFAITPGRGYEFVTKDGVTDTTWYPTLYSNEAGGSLLARRKATPQPDLEQHFGTLTEPDRAPAWAVKDGGQEVNLESRIDYSDARIYLPVKGLVKKVDYREPGISHIVNVLVHVPECDNIVFTAYRPDRSSDALTENVIGCGITRKDDQAAIWFDVGNFKRPWQDGEEVVIIIEASKQGRGYFTVLNVTLDRHVDIQDIVDKIALTPIPEPAVVKGSVKWRGVDNENVVGYSLYHDDKRINEKVIARSDYSAEGALVLKPVIKGGYETVYDSHGAQGRPGTLIPLAYAFDIYPNPFSKQTRIDYALPQQTTVDIKIYDVTGKLVTTLVSERLDPGYYQVDWHGTDNIGRRVSAGVYFVQMNTKGFDTQHKVIFVR